MIEPKPRAKSCKPLAVIREAGKRAASGSWLVAILMAWSGSFAQEVHVPLNDGWQFQQIGKEQWYSAEVPGVVQTDLMRHGLIPDIYKGSNIDSVQWIENEDWVYKRTIVATDSLLNHGHLDLVFKGLDTFAEVYLNDSLIGKADNMFRTWEWPIKSLLRLGPNELKVIFRSPIREGAKLRDAYGIQLPHDNDPTGVSPYIRKAAYQFGWDFCPRLVTSGIWQRVELRGWSKARVREVQMISDLFGKHPPGFSLMLQRDTTLHAPFFFDVWVDGERVAHGVKQKAIERKVLRAEHDEWWPNGSGPRHTYQVRIVMRYHDEVLSEVSLLHSKRRIGWIRDEDNTGRQFACMVNGKPVFIRGCNLIPPSMLLPSAGDGAWVKLVSDMQRARMNMVRVWAGGVYPPEAFYHACDTAGILVWLDVMVANMLPAEGAFLKNIEREAYEQVDRAEKHPSVALICGNNELNVAWANWGWQERYHLHGSDSSRVINTNLGLWNRTLLGATHPFWNYTPTSPLSNWGNAEGLKHGDLHYWGVWHGDSTFSSFKNNVGRFVSEYGFQSYPDSALLAKYIDPKDLYLGSTAMKRLQRSYKTDRPIWEAMEHELGEKPTTLGGFIEGSQRAQALAYEMAIEAHLSAQPHCMGTLLWQLNDCWPGPSWSIIDFAGNPKPAYHAVKRLYTRTP
jgi:beta-mannosidase